MYSLPEQLLNTTDKGYSVIITMPNKMSLVRDSFFESKSLLMPSCRRKKPRFEPLVPKSSVPPQKLPGTRQRAI